MTHIGDCIILTVWAFHFTVNQHVVEGQRKVLFCAIESRGLGQAGVRISFFRYLLYVIMDIQRRMASNKIT